MVLSIERWVGKVAVVTGASAGIGAAIAAKLVEDGLQVVGLARRTELIDEAAKKLTNKKGKLISCKVDLTKDDEIIKAFEWIKENVGLVHVLVNNAGVFPKNTLINGDIEKWRQTFNVNVLSLCIATREAINQMKSGHINGHVFHINSVAGHYPIMYPMNVYAASKYAVTALTESLRQEINAENLKIKITSISPGTVESEMTTEDPLLNEEKKQFLKDLPILKAEDIADGLHYALSTPEHVQIFELTIQPVGENLG